MKLITHMHAHTHAFHDAGTLWCCCQVQGSRIYNSHLLPPSLSRKSDFSAPLWCERRTSIMVHYEAGDRDGAEADDRCRCWCRPVITPSTERSVWSHPQNGCAAPTWRSGGEEGNESQSGRKYCLKWTWAAFGRTTCHKVEFHGRGFSAWLQQRAGLRGMYTGRCFFFCTVQWKQM